ncbi:MAG: YhbY family RNA-binding protein [Clostridia bacterium]
MLDSKKRATLRGLANTEETIVHIGKGGVTPSVITQVEEALAARELVKGRVLESAMLTPNAVLETLCEALRAEPVMTIGTRFVLYRKNPKNPKIDLGK